MCCQLKKKIFFLENPGAPGGPASSGSIVSMTSELRNPIDFKIKEKPKSDRIVPSNFKSDIPNLTVKNEYYQRHQKYVIQIAGLSEIHDDTSLTPLMLSVKQTTNLHRAFSSYHKRNAEGKTKQPPTNPHSLPPKVKCQGCQSLLPLRPMHLAKSLLIIITTMLKILNLILTPIFGAVIINERVQEAR